MRFIKPLVVAALAIGLASPAIAQTDPHHPEGDVTPPAEAGMPATVMARPAAPTPADAATQCPDMMGMMQGGGTLMPMMQMHMMAMMQMHMQMMQQMQQMQSRGMMQPEASVSPQMQMMEMMRSMQMMQMDLMGMMQQMQNGTAAPEASTEGAKP